MRTVVVDKIASVTQACGLGNEVRVATDYPEHRREVEIVELTFPANSDSGDHRHAVTETFYLLEGELDQVVNGTPEPDGTYKHYFLQVPPTMRTPREAVAWTYGLSERHYRLAMRT